MCECLRCECVRCECVRGEARNVVVVDEENI